MRLSLIVFVSLFIVASEAVRFGGDYFSYPRVPSGNNKRGGMSHLASHELLDSTASKISLQSIGAALKSVQNYLGAGIVFMALLKLVQDKGYFGPNFALPGLARSIKPNSEDNTTKELKKDQEEIWNAILNIHNTQKISKEDVEANTAAIQALRSEQDTFAQQYKVKMVAITTRLDEIDQSLLEISQSVADLTLSVDARELREGLNAVEDRVERESRATAASVQQIREELPEMMQRHDSLVTEKLGKFKEDLKRLLVGNKQGGAGSTGSAGNASGGRDSKETAKPSTKSSTKKK